MGKKVLVIAFFMLFGVRDALAQESFTSFVNVEYKVQADGKVGVTHTVRIRNNTTNDYTKAYVLNLVHLNPKNIKAYEDGRPVDVDISSDDGIHKLTLNFANPVVGKEKTRVFVVTYEEDSMVKQSGDVWEISVPRQESGINYADQRIVLSVPKELGEEAIVSPEPAERESGEARNVYSFEGVQLEKSGITAVFGKFQVFSFDLTYHLTNDKNENTQKSIAIPPDVSTQRVFYEDILPKPKNVTTDADGNWLASFDVSPKKEIAVKVRGYIQVFAKPLKVLTPYPDTLLANLKPQEFWETNDPAIKGKANGLKTPKAIYDFVVDKLEYNYDRVKPDVERLGAAKVLNMPTEAICMEFTDLFIALSRAAGIPAREINGYAYSDNLNLQPLSLVADVLHAWPEYWDEEDQVWVPVDPTWEATSKIDYFDKFDLRHLAFVIHGKDSKTPLPAGSYRASGDDEKDVFINFSTIPEEIKNEKIEIDYTISQPLNIFRKKVIIKIKNAGATALYNITPKISYDGFEETQDTIPQLIPYGYAELEKELPLGLFATKIPSSIHVSTQNQDKEILLEKNKFIFSQLLVVFLFLLAVLAFFGLRTRLKKP